MSRYRDQMKMLAHLVENHMFYKLKFPALRKTRNYQKFENIKTIKQNKKQYKYPNLLKDMAMIIQSH